MSTESMHDEEAGQNGLSSNEPLLSDKEPNSESEYNFERSQPRAQRRAQGLQKRRLLHFSLTALAIFLVVVMVHLLRPIAKHPPSLCLKPSIRKEWRELSQQQKLEYLRAVKCLTEIPSERIENGTLHDEFAYTHLKIGNSSHESASFLPWHRYFINTYEKTLRTKCGYSGSLPYWNWIQDSQDVRKAPVFDAVAGFGGNGDTSSSPAVSRGHCVRDGPFAGLQVQFFSAERQPHCLSRLFNDEYYLDTYGSPVLNATAIAVTLSDPDYYSFLLGLENGPHLSIPIIIQGDFAMFSAPNDPLFFLHHAQLDRLWWEWVSHDAHTRLQHYNGPARSKSATQASLSDMIEMYDLVPSVPVSDLVDIQGGFLCYKYE